MMMKKNQSDFTIDRLKELLGILERHIGIKQNGQCFHRFRNTFANNIIEADLSVLSVQELMRHKNIQTTIKHYRQYNAQKLLVDLDKTFNQTSTKFQQISVKNEKF